MFLEKGYFQCLQESDDLSLESDDLFPPEYYGKALELDSPTATLSEDLFSEK